MTRRKAGDPVPRGRVLGLTGKFCLDPSLTEPGAISPTDAVNGVITQLLVQAGEGHITTTVVTSCYQGLIGSFARYMTAIGHPTIATIRVNDVVDWINAPTQFGPVTRSEQVARRSAARVFFIVAARIGLWDQNPAVPIQLTGKYARYVNAFTDEQMLKLKRTAAYSERDAHARVDSAPHLRGHIGRARVSAFVRR